jgi:hypothetical protein
LANTSDWTTLFDGTSFEGWHGRDARGAAREHTWRVAGDVRLRPDNDRLFAIGAGTGVMVNGDDGRTADLSTDTEHGSCELHVEFCVPGGSNSGVYLMGNYEVQVLDSWGTPDSELKYGSSGGIYARWIAETQTPYDGNPPRTNASRPPGEWQSFDILFHAPKFDEAGRKIGNARFERVLYNGVLIHEGFECTGPTRGPWSEVDVPRGPLRLQGDHGPVAYRNIRIRPLD